MTPIQYYQKLLESDQILKDPQQEHIIQQLQIIFDQLNSQPSKGLLEAFSKKRSTKITGLYLWGDVGVGKTFLMDTFFYCLPFKEKLRIHFHQFMRMIHENMQSFKGHCEPLVKVAQQIANSNRVICFDELFVTNITDAMLLARLFEILYQNHVCLLFTSNTPPDLLYRNGIQRNSFIPAIELIKNHTKVMEIQSNHDYRFNNLDQSFYYSPLNDATQEMLQQQFNQRTQQQPITTLPLKVLERDINVQKRADNIIWFNFLDICGIPRSQQDYLEIAKSYNTIIVSNVMAIQSDQTDLARSFINFIDVMYDANKKVIISAEKPIEQIYVCGRLLFEFARTRSRLTEMQTAAWHAKCN